MTINGNYPVDEIVTYIVRCGGTRPSGRSCEKSTEPCGFEDDAIAEAKQIRFIVRDGVAYCVDCLPGGSNDPS